MEDRSPNTYKKYFASRRADDLTSYARDQLKNINLSKRKENNLQQVSCKEQIPVGEPMDISYCETDNTKCLDKKEGLNIPMTDSLNQGDNEILNRVDGLTQQEESNQFGYLVNETYTDELLEKNLFPKYEKIIDSYEFEEGNFNVPLDFFNSDDEESTENSSKEKIRSLNDLIGSKGFFDIIKTPVAISPGELFLIILKFCKKNSLSMTSMSNLFSLINTIFETPVLPQSRYKLDQIFNEDNETVFHAVCPSCSGYIGKLEDFESNTLCTTCKTNVDMSKPSCENVFVTINPSIAIKEILQIHEQYYDDVVMNKLSKHGIIADIHDGKMYREFVNLLPNHEKSQYVTVTFNSDGAPPFTSSKYSMWPIYLMINEIPVQDRFKNLIPCGLWFNKKKPNMSIFLDSFVDEMNSLQKEGISCQILGEERKIKVYALVCCVDSVARAPMQGIKQFNGKYGCNWCLHPGEWIGSMKYPISDEEIPERDVSSTLFYMKQSVENENYKPIYGIKNISALVNLNFFNIIHGFVPDYMHCCLNGVGKQITKYLVSNEDLQFYQKLLENIKCPNQLSRLTRPLSDNNYWKCREWENWILYFSTPLLSLKLPSEMIHYWTLYVYSLYTLLQTSLSYADLQKADKILREFVCKTEQYFGKIAMTYNVHLLLHLAQSVLDWGPLWAHSAFAFEAGNHQILQAIKCAKGVILQILRQINVNRSILILEKKIFPTAPEAVKIYLHQVLQLRVKKCVQVSNNFYFGKDFGIEEELIRNHTVSQNSKSYYRMIKDGCLYNTCLKENKRSDNSYARLEDGTYVRLIKFIVDFANNIEYSMCHVIHTCENNLNTNFNVLRKVTKIDEDIKIIPTKDVKTVCINIEADNTEYICQLANLFFY